MRHFFQRRSNQPAQSYHVHLFFNCTLNDCFGRNHHTQIDNVISVASHHHRNDILSDIVNIPFHCGKQYFSGRGCCLCLFRLNDRLKDGNGFLHCPSCLHHLREKHFAGSEKLAHIVHSIHQRTFNHVHRFIVEWQRFRQILFEIITDSLHQGIFQTFLNRAFSPSILLGCRLSGCSAHRCLQRLSQFDKTFCRIRATIQDDILYLFKYIGRNITIQHGSARIHNSHIHSLLNGMIKEHGMHGLTNIVVATERERKVAYPTADMRTGKILLYPSGSFNKIYGIVVVFFDSRSYGKYVGVENNIVRIEIYFVNQEAICALAYLYLTCRSIRLAFFIKSHHYSRCSVLLDSPGMFKKLLFALFQRDRVDD